MPKACKDYSKQIEKRIRMPKVRLTGRAGMTEKYHHFVVICRMF